MGKCGQNVVRVFETVMMKLVLCRITVFLFYFMFMYMGAFLHACLCISCVQCPQRPEKGIRSLVLWIKPQSSGGLSSIHNHWEISPVPNYYILIFLKTDESWISSIWAPVPRGHLLCDPEQVKWLFNLQFSLKGNSNDSHSLWMFRI